MPPRLSFVVPTYNKCARLRLTLANLLHHARPHGYEIIVIDDGSTDGTADLLRSLRRRYRSLETLRTPGLGRGGARNRGAKAACGELLVFVDDDILVCGGFALEHLAAHEKARAPVLVHGRLREMVGVSRVVDPSLGGPGAPPIREAVLEARGFDPLGYRLFTNALEAAVEHLFPLGADNPAPWIAAAGANISLPRASWEAMGGFDEGFGRAWGCEDLEFGYRLHASGHGIVFWPQAYGVHMTHSDSGRGEQHRANLARFVELHPSHEVRSLRHLLGQRGSAKAFLREISGIQNLTA